MTYTQVVIYEVQSSFLISEILQTYHIFHSYVPVCTGKRIKKGATSDTYIINEALSVICIIKKVTEVLLFNVYKHHLSFHLRTVFGFVFVTKCFKTSHKRKSWTAECQRFAVKTVVIWVRQMFLKHDWDLDASNYFKFTLIPFFLLNSVYFICIIFLLK